jgi:hypothetical protein
MAIAIALDIDADRQGDKVLQPLNRKGHGTDDCRINLILGKRRIKEIFDNDAIDTASGQGCRFLFRPIEHSFETAAPAGGSRQGEQMNHPDHWVSGLEDAM